MDYLFLKAYLLGFIEPVYEYFGFDDSVSDPHLDQLSRSLTLSWACHLGIEECIDKSITLFSQWMTNPDDPL